jgi:hypothetical protein
MHRYNTSSVQPLVDMCHVPNISITIVSGYEELKLKAQSGYVRFRASKQGMISMALGGHNNEIRPIDLSLSDSC